jgi:DUF4097 and DUF4098 domain-containing protein YvlB
MSYSGRRRSSIFGGLLLILIGALFLIHNLAPGMLHVGEIVRYWPVLLILWGLARLWDYFAAMRTGQAAPRVVTGGELLLILLVLVGVAALVAYDRMHRNTEWQSGFGLFGNPYTFTTTLPPEPVEPSMQVKLWTPRGDISIHPQPEKSLSVIVTKTVHATDQSEAQKAADETTVSIRKTAEGVQVNPEIRGGGDQRVSYDASVFPKTSLVASTGRGDLHVTGIEGEISLSAAGQVDVSQTRSNTTVDMRRGDARIHAVKGNVTVNGRGQQVDIGEIKGSVSINGEFYGPIRVRQVGKSVSFNSRRTALNVGAPLGRLDMASGRMTLSDTTGNVSLETRDKDIQFENVQGAIRIVDRNGNIEVRYSQPPRHDLDVTNRSGDISVVMPNNSAFTITAMARSGDISSDFRGPQLKLAEADSRAVLNGTLGSGGPKIVLNTTYGTIHVRRAPPVPPVPPPVPAAPRPDASKHD